MTEDDWLTTPAVGDLAAWLGSHRLLTPRKVRLYHCAFARLLAPRVGDSAVLAAAERAELYANHLISDALVENSYRKMTAARGRLYDDIGWFISPDDGLRDRAYRAAALACRSRHQVRGPQPVPGGLTSDADVALDPELLRTVNGELADVVRELFGNPFRPVAFAPRWRTSTVTSLGRQAYGSRDFSTMPILADALQDAGCEEPVILDHCRGPGPHVRGCWVVDAVLNKA
jgi:hypothetical protein